MEANPVLLQVFKNRLSSIAEEMGVTLSRTAYSPNIKERKDYSCAIFDSSGEMIAQAAHIPVHLGSMPMSVKEAVKRVNFAKGDMVVLNDPFQGGTHLPDITLVAPIFAGEEMPSFYIANRAHHVDVGGMSPGSMPLSTSLYQEGLIIPPVKLVENGEIDSKVRELILNNVRTPKESEGDFSSQIMANIIGIRRMEELVAKYSLEEVEFYAQELIKYAERIMHKTIQDIPDGKYEFEDFLDSDGAGNYDIKISVTIEIKGNKAVLDFSGSHDQVKGSVNAVYAITISAVLYVFRCLTLEDIPTNAGCLKPVEIITRRGSIVDAEFPAAVSAGNVETSQRIVDVILGALAQGLPTKIPAASQGTMNNVTIGGRNSADGSSFAYYETIGGGTGAGNNVKGEDAVHSHMTNTLNTPVEALEYSYPFKVESYFIRKGSGGDGKQMGGSGIVREIRLLEDGEVTVISERRRYPPYGLWGGKPGMSGKNIVVKNGIPKKKPDKFSEKLVKGDKLRIETPGGGGFGKP